MRTASNSTIPEVLRGSGIVAIGQAAGVVIVFLRNIVIARAISPTEFGVALTFALVMSVLEMASDFAWDKMLIQAKFGSKHRFQETVHSMTLIRSVFMSACLFFFAGMIASAFGGSDTKGAYQMLALVPLIKGFMHMDSKRYQRYMKFLPETSINFIGQLFSLVVAIIGAFLLDDYRVMLFSLLAQALVICIVSHCVATRPYRLSLEKSYIIEIIVFGWPLLLNGLLLILATEADKVLVGASFGMVELSIYGLIALMLGTPGMVIRRTLSSVALPLLSNLKHSSQDWINRHSMLGVITVLIAISMSVFMNIFGSRLINVFFGKHYDADNLLVIWLCLAYGSMIVRAWPTISIIAIARNKIILYANLAKLLGFCFALISIKLGFTYLWVAAGVAIGEVIATFVSLILLGKHLSISLWLSIRYYILFLTLMVGSAAYVLLFPVLSAGLFLPILFIIISLFMGLASLLVMTPYSFEFLKMMILRFGQRKTLT